ncbi:MAG: PadR family transcriptional regulator PadR [Pseudoalteromonas tetraodonis]|jgi:PadR family transcriptional regulator PadR
MAEISRELVAASSKPLVLSILAKGESYGYEIISQVKELSGGKLEWTDGMLYPVLHRLERDGFIKAVWKKSDAGRDRKYYRLKAAGKKEIAQLKAQWHSVSGALGKLWDEGGEPCPN